ncbi:CaiB/BaiF CoA transferase family protein [Chelatococcus asaccharovorans]|uniref:Crotonobetainyl-CoA:carnitine CoA-transferase CaiB-like acyl-CoA transferase n=1 Tax=Chelatococcus asaccharovorans TaxID=28210 RepID=A0A2V3U1L2_9HYPH|nr:CoA transferase [Chelatococcus asaccharovorans]MBS7704393.1 CoA transferase [Chelatococcus asaccharovorans]PXW55728.1 crotonobetainyl-CoA:carnitine CoA-transferase CaiB-like acyl-CoA transferase [Chelatococcus asaccharovorans]
MADRGPLSGYRVVEFGSNLTAPLATMLMGDQGADVIKVEAPAGDQLRGSGESRSDVSGMGTMFLNANRNKRSIVLDLKSEADRAAAIKIAAASDVVVQNFRPGVIDRLGLGYEALRAIRDDIIYVSIDGLGRTGPAAGRRVYDIVVQGIAGFAGIQADPLTRTPDVVRNAVTDKIAALSVFQAVTAALLVRERTGKGQHVEVSMLNAALSFLWPETMGRATLIGDGVKPGGSVSGTRYCFPTADGSIILGFVTASEFAAVCAVLECPHLLAEPDFATLGQRFVNAARLNAEIGAILLTRTTAEWLARLDAVDAVYAPVNWPEDIITDPQIAATGILEVHDHPVVGRYRQPAHPARFSETPAGLHRHAPVLGADGAEILAEVGLPTQGAGQ